MRPDDLLFWGFIAIAVVVANLLYIIPIQKILRRAGFSGWWTLLLYGGPFMIVGLWVFAFRNWPAVDKES